MVDSERIKVTPEVAASAGYLGQRSAAMESELDTLRPRVAELSATWTGDGSAGAADDYFRYQKRWDDSAAGLFGDPATGTPGLLPSIARAMGIVSTNYFEVEQTNRSGWQYS